MKKGCYQRFFKRFFDVLLSLIAIIILSPILLLVYILSLIFLLGDPILRQYRPGKDGKIFMLYKFRSMTNKKDENGNLLPDKDRITWWGKVLRKTSLDELPQLFNILKGDMSIVGPRPRLVKDVIFYPEEVLKYFNVRPGITGPDQVYDRNSENSWEEVFKRAKDYSENVTLKNDLKLLFGTFTAVFKGGSAEGAGSTNGKEKVEKREYYYPDHLLKTNQITQEQYNLGLQLAKDKSNKKNIITFEERLHNREEENDTKQKNNDDCNN